MGKTGTLSIFGIVGAYVSSVFGGWDESMTTLIIFMLFDYITGLIVAGIFKKSTKTLDGGLESKAGFKGLIKKFAVLILVLVACRLDAILGTDYIKDCVIIAFIANETISITENIGLMGVPLPNAIKKAITLLNERNDNGI